LLGRDDTVTNVDRSSMVASSFYFGEGKTLNMRPLLRLQGLGSSQGDTSYSGVYVNRILLVTMSAYRSATSLVSSTHVFRW